MEGSHGNHSAPSILKLSSSILYEWMHDPYSKIRCRYYAWSEASVNDVLLLLPLL